jgi:hypothetical protein
MFFMKLVPPKTPKKKLRVFRIGTTLSSSSRSGDHPQKDLALMVLTSIVLRTVVENNRAANPPAQKLKKPSVQNFLSGLS